MISNPIKQPYAKAHLGTQTNGRGEFIYTSGPNQIFAMITIIGINVVSHIARGGNC